MGWSSASDATAKLTGVSTNGWVQAGNEPGQRMTAGSEFVTYLLTHLCKSD